MATTRGLLIGRFQPFHRGHEQLVERIAREVDEVIVGIGSADQSHTRRDPFTAGERIVMISNVLAEMDTPSYVVPIEDLNRNSVWVSHAESMCPPFDVVYSNNPLVIRLFEESDYEVRDSEMFDREELRGTDIRERMIAGDGWRESVPAAVVAAIDEIDGVGRIQTIADSDAALDDRP